MNDKVQESSNQPNNRVRIETHVCRILINKMHFMRKAVLNTEVSWFIDTKNATPLIKGGSLWRHLERHFELHAENWRLIGLDFPSAELCKYPLMVADHIINREIK